MFRSQFAVAGSRLPGCSCTCWTHAACVSGRTVGVDCTGGVSMSNRGRGWGPPVKWCSVCQITDPWWAPSNQRSVLSAPDQNCFQIQFINYDIYASDFFRACKKNTSTVRCKSEIYNSHKLLITHASHPQTQMMPFEFVLARISVVSINS
jgi:hypothetical protein